MLRVYLHSEGMCEFRACQHPSRLLIVSTMGTRSKTSKDDVVWVAVEQGVVVRFGSNRKPDALVITGTINSERLRNLHLNRWEHIDPDTTDLPTWQQIDAPQLIEVAVALIPKASRERAIDECLDYEESTGIPHPDVINEIRESIDPEASADDFYKELALVIKRIAPFTLSPNTAISLALDVNKNTAAQYISRCRKRGYLPPSRRSTP